MTWTKTGTDTYLGSSRTSGQTSATLAAGTVGDLRVVQFLTISSSVSVNTLSGGGVTTWKRAGSANAVSANTIGVAATAETWYGVITSTGTALTITYNGTVGSTSCRLMKRDYRSSRGITSIAAVGNGFSQTNNHTTSSPLTWPSLTTSNPGQLLVGVMGNFGGPTYTGTTTGFTYTLDTDGNDYNYNLSPANSTAFAPQMTYTGTDGWYVQETLFDDGGTTATATAGLASASAAGFGDTAAGSKAAALASVSAAAKAAVAFVTGVAGKASATAAALAAVASISPTAGQAAVSASAFNASALLAEKPERRRYTVPPEPRTLGTAEVRRYTVPPDIRVITAVPES